MNDLPPAIAALYRQPLPSTRTGATFAAHAYPTKVDPAAIAICLLAHTQPGDRVLDCFSGSGSAGIAAVLCEHPPPALRSAAQERLGSDIAWGPRDAELVDLGALPAFLAGTLVSGVDPKAFGRAARAMLAQLKDEWGWMYAATAPDGSVGALRHMVWTEHAVVDGQQHSIWDLAVRLAPPSLAAKIATAAGPTAIGKLERVLCEAHDPLLGRPVTARVRSPAYTWGRSGTTLWRRPIAASDLELIQRIHATPLPSDIPLAPMCGVAEGPWGEMHRGGYHRGLTHLHQFYSRRNLLAVAAARRAARGAVPALRDALQLWVSSYDAAHSTLMTRIVVKKGAKDLVLTSAQPGALYVSSLPVEKNVFAGLKSKIRSFEKAFSALHGHRSRVRAHQASALALPLPSESIDYVFTDPPFGDNIQYSEVNFISEAWLGLATDPTQEAVVSRFQGKGVDDYRQLLTGAFAELFRVLRPGGYATVVFHSAHSAVWEALRRAWTDAGFSFETSSVLDKQQRAFKQTTTRGAVAKDPIVLLRKPAAGAVPSATATVVLDPWAELQARLDALAPEDPQRSRDHLWAWLITRYLAQGQRPPMDAAAFFEGLASRHGIGHGGPSS